MNWLAPIEGVQSKRIILRKDGARMPDTSREVIVDGARFRSMSEACRSFGRSASWVYARIGEGWRCGCVTREIA